MLISSGEAVGRALESIAPHTLASEIAPGRFGLLGSGGTKADLVSTAALLEKVLSKHGVEVSVAARHMSLSPDELTPTQAARALRQALNVFAREGSIGLGQAGFDGGLAGYIRRAGTQATNLRHAIRRNQFSLVFQAIVSLSYHSLHHFEALIRPSSATDRSISGPREFIMLVAALGLADELDMEIARMDAYKAVFLVARGSSAS